MLGKKVIGEARSGRLVKIKSGVLAVLEVILVGWLTSWESEYTEQSSQNSFAWDEKGFIPGGCVFRNKMGKFKSPSKNKGDEGNREETRLIASCKLSMKVAGDEGER